MTGKIIFLLCIVAGVINGLALGTAKSACEELCTKCGGEGLIKDETCECRLPADKDVECLKEGLNSDGYLEWAPEAEAEDNNNRLRRSISPKIRPNSFNRLPTISKHKRRVPRKAQFFDVGYAPSHDMDYDSNDMFRNYRSNGKEKFERSQVYEVLIGDDDEESLQLVFPDSNGLELEHQYLFRDDNGQEHPYSSPKVESPQPLREKDIDFEDYYQLKGLWNSQPSNYPKKEQWGNNADIYRPKPVANEPWGSNNYNDRSRDYNQINNEWDRYLSNGL